MPTVTLPSGGYRVSKPETSLRRPIFQRKPQNYKRHAAGNTKPTPTTKRKRADSSMFPLGHQLDAIDLTGGDKNDKSMEIKGRKVGQKKGQGSPSKIGGTEKRLKRFRSHPPRSYLERLERVGSQRMFLLDRNVGGSEECPEGSFDLAGSTGNVYTVKIGRVPSCSCPDNRVNKNQCKHIIYVLVNILKAPHDMQYQLALLSSELCDIFELAPPPPEAQSRDRDEAGHRKPVEGDCPICILELEPEHSEIIWCKAGCGNNIHKQCFEQWAASKPGEEVRCVFCRTAWQGDDDSVKKIYKSRGKNAEGYVNVASELGMPGGRDYSTYHQPWVHRRFGYGI